MTTIEERLRVETINYKAFEATVPRLTQNISDPFAPGGHRWTLQFVKHYEEAKTPKPKNVYATFSEWCESVKDCDHIVQPNSATARQRKLGWDAAMASKTNWFDPETVLPEPGFDVCVWYAHSNSCCTLRYEQGVWRDYMENQGVDMMIPDRWSYLPTTNTRR